MSPPPVRVEIKASFVPSGEYSGRDSSAGFEMRRRASPPSAGAVQMSPPEAKAISLPSGEMAGVARDGLEDCAKVAAEKTRINRNDESEERRNVHLGAGRLDCVLMTRRLYHAGGRGHAEFVRASQAELPSPRPASRRFDTR